MAEIETAEFNEIWRQKGYLAALDSSPKHGNATLVQARAAHFKLQRKDLLEARKELARLSAVLGRLEHTAAIGATGGRVETQQYERDVAEFGGWIASLMESYTWIQNDLSETAYQKTLQMIEGWRHGVKVHPSRVKI